MSASVYTRNSDHGEQLMSKIRSGMCFINEVAKSEAVFPTGGVGRSGYGRECGLAGFREFANVRAYYVN